MNALVVDRTNSMKFSSRPPSSQSPQIAGHGLIHFGLQFATHVDSFSQSLMTVGEHLRVRSIDNMIRIFNLH